MDHNARHTAFDLLARKEFALSAILLAEPVKNFIAEMTTFCENAPYGIRREEVFIRVVHILFSVVKFAQLYEVKRGSYVGLFNPQRHVLRSIKTMLTAPGGDNMA